MMNSHLEKNFSELLPEYIQGTLDKNMTQQVKTWLSHSDEAKAEHEFLSSIMTQANNEVFEVSDNIRENFYRELSMYQAAEQRVSLVSKIISWLSNQQQALKLVYGLMLFSAGIIFSEFWLNKNSDSFDSQKLVAEVAFLKQQVLRSQLEHPNVSNRLKAVRYGLEFENLPTDVVSVLEETILNDKNQHVRVAAAQVLMRFIESPQVQVRFTDILLRQNDTTVQLMMLGMMVEWDKNKGEAMVKQIQQTTKSNRVKQLLNQMI